MSSPEGSGASRKRARLAFLDSSSSSESSEDEEDEERRHADLEEATTRAINSNTVKLSDLPSDELREKFFALLGYICSICWQDNPRLLLQRVQKDISENPVLARTVPHENASADHWLSQLVLAGNSISICTRRTQGKLDYEETIFIFVKAHPEIVLLKWGGHWANVLDFLFFKSKNLGRRTLFWLAQRFPRILDEMYEGTKRKFDPIHFNLILSNNEGVLRKFYEQYPGGLDQFSIRNASKVESVLHRSARDGLDLDFIAWLLTKINPEALTLRQCYDFDDFDWYTEHTIFMSACQSIDSMGRPIFRLYRTDRDSYLANFSHLLLDTMIKHPSIAFSALGDCGRSLDHLVRSRNSRVSTQHLREDLVLKLLRIRDNLVHSSKEDDTEKYHCKTSESSTTRFLYQAERLVRQEAKVVEERYFIRKAFILLRKRDETFAATHGRDDDSKSHQLRLAYEEWMEERLEPRPKSTGRIQDIRTSIESVKQSFRLQN